MAKKNVYKNLKTNNSTNLRRRIKKKILKQLTAQTCVVFVSKTSEIELISSFLKGQGPHYEGCHHPTLSLSFFFDGLPTVSFDLGSAHYQGFCVKNIYTTVQC